MDELKCWGDVAAMCALLDIPFSKKPTSVMINYHTLYIIGCSHFEFMRECRREIQDAVDRRALYSGSARAL